VTGGILNVEKDAIKVMEGIAAHIEAKHRKLGI